MAAIEKAGHPVVRISMADIYDLGAEFFRWEIATAVAGSIIGINAFNQPDVEASKIATRELDVGVREDGFPAGGKTGGRRRRHQAVHRREECRGTGEGRRRRQVARWISEGSSGPHQGRRLLRGAGLHPDECRARTELCRRFGMRCATRSAWRPVLGFGPRFLHSTGQAYKGGPNSGVFLQITCDDAVELPVPGQKYTFGVVKAAQARGDFQVLAERGRRALRVHLGSNLKAGLATLQAAVQKAL